MKNLNKISLFVVVCLSLSGCDINYWWSRGQAPATSTLLQHAEKSYEETKSAEKFSRQDIIGLTDSLKTNLSTTAEMLAKNSKQFTPEMNTRVQSVLEGMYKLDGKLSVTNRVPLSELTGQMRAYLDHASKKGEFSVENFNLLAARTIFLIGGELAVPPPPFTS